MVFTPPPSPLPPAHLTSNKRLAEDDDSDDSSFQYLTVPSFHEPSQPSPEVEPPDLSFQSTKLNPPISPPSISPTSSSSILLSTPVRRRLLVFLVPAILLLIGSTTNFIHRHGAHVNEALHAAQYQRPESSYMLRDRSLESPPGFPIVRHSLEGQLGTLSQHLRSSRRYHGFIASPARRDIDDVMLDTRADHVVAIESTPTSTATALLDTTPSGIPTPTIPKNDLQQTAPAIPTPALPLPTPCELTNLFAFHFTVNITVPDEWDGFSINSVL